MLVALGRTPLTKDLGLELVGLTPGETIHVDAHNRVPGHDWLYAIGDINGKALFTHMGKYQARISADHLLGHDHVLAHGADGKLSPRVIFTEPQVAAVGHTAESAKEAGLEIEIVETETSGNAGGSFYGRNAPGTTRWIVDRERRIVVGCTITGAEVADFLHAATIAIVGEVPVERLRHAVPSFPTRSRDLAEALKEVDAKGAARGPSTSSPGKHRRRRFRAAGLSPHGLALCVSTFASGETLFLRPLAARKTPKSVHPAFSEKT